MHRAVLGWLGVLLVFWFSFALYPGHTYLASSSQLYVAMLQRLAAPGYLTRDLVATHPNLTYTAYDEITLALKQVGHVDFEAALAIQHSLARLAGTLGLFLTARSLKLSYFKALTVAATVGLGTYLAGPNLRLFDTEPVPGAFALGLTLMAIGCLVNFRPLLAGFFGGVALIYSPTIAAPFWITLLLALAFDRHLRKLLRPTLPILVIFVLLLANLAQLQPATEVGSALSGVLPETMRRIEQIRLPELWVSLWDRKAVHLCAALFVIGIGAVTRVWPVCNRPLRWFLFLLPALGMISIPVSFLLLDWLHMEIVTRIGPLQALALAVAMIWLACASAALYSFGLRRKRESFAWLAVCILIATGGIIHPVRHVLNPDVEQLAAWAESGTWGSSVFLFPDVGRGLEPGVFRGLSRRALWVDWESGAVLRSSSQLAPEWWSRWKRTVATGPTSEPLTYALTQPIDYYVLQRRHIFEASDGKRLRGIPAVYVNRSYLVYDAADLRAAPGTIRMVDVSPSR